MNPLTKAIRQRDLPAINRMLNACEQAGMRYKDIYRMAKEAAPELDEADWDALVEECESEPQEKPKRP